MDSVIFEVKIKFGWNDYWLEKDVSEVVARIHLFFRIWKTRKECIQWLYLQKNRAAAFLENLCFRAHLMYQIPWKGRNYPLSGSSLSISIQLVSCALPITFRMELLLLMYHIVQLVLFSKRVVNFLFYQHGILCLLSTNYLTMYIW